MITAASIKTPALVYVANNGRVSAQLWFEPCADLNGYWRDRIVGAHPLVGSVARTLIEARNIEGLSSLYPPPTITEDQKP